MSQILIPVAVLGGLGILFGLLLAYASRKFAVKEDERIPAARALLPGANCGGCGYAGCDAYAKAMVEGSAPIGRCTVGGKETADKLGQLLGKKVEQETPMAAYVHCHGSLDHAERRYRYNGPKDCLEASVLPGHTAKECPYGCLGFGSCTTVCQFDAIHVVNGVAVVDPDKCTACGACIRLCPQHVISFMPKTADHPLSNVHCSNPERGKKVKDICKAGCLGCTLCQRNCPRGAITMNGGLPSVDFSKCNGCGQCAKVCPVHAIELS